MTDASPSPGRRPGRPAAILALEYGSHHRRTMGQRTLGSSLTPPGSPGNDDGRRQELNSHINPGSGAVTASSNS